MKIKLRSSLLVSAIALFSAIAASAFDWPAKPNDRIRDDMIGFAKSLRDTTMDANLKAKLSTFIEQQETARAVSSAKYVWMGQTHALVADLLSRYTPALENIEVRKGVFEILDYPLHVNNLADNISAEELAAYNKTIEDYIGTAKARIFSELESVIPKEGVIVWQLYNMGFIIRSPKHTIAIDISGRPATFVLTEGKAPMNRKYSGLYTDTDYDRLVRQIDTIYVTHLHGDHMSIPLLEKMLDARKTVVLVADAKLVDPKMGLASVLKPSTNLIVLDKSNTEPLDINGVKVRNFVGNQGESTPCNIYHLDIDGTVIIHNGDNCDRIQETRLANCPPANIIIASSWNDMASFVGNAQKAQGFSKANAILIPAHENELMHSVGHRESYRELYTRGDRLGNKAFVFPPAFVLNCGESLTYPALNSRRPEGR